MLGRKRLASLLTHSYCTFQTGVLEVLSKLGILKPQAKLAGASSGALITTSYCSGLGPAEIIGAGHALVSGYCSAWRPSLVISHTIWANPTWIQTIERQCQHRSTLQSRGTLSQPSAYIITYILNLV
jgi:hypothetical protein